ncbi:TLC domain-containing protein At5g14285 isoform X3 [Vicia villosa]|uniref:TLC domain-containing protein At5g14285 isoform X3 n=1 Tax=Vicia villosa TaxID=3911 RepID=UPI00273AC3EA|nr:TLC domain-containing protein At5g14285 isoform X3 [Vicia villosa]
MGMLLLQQDWLVFPFFFFFLSIYLFGYLFLFRNKNPKIRTEFSSCLISLFHGTPAAILGAIALFSDPNRGFAASNTSFQKTVLDYSIAYFVTDLLHYVVFIPGDVLFIAHHLATLFVIVTCRYVVSHGAFSVVVLLVLAEVTSACQNTWTLAGACRLENRFAARVYDALSPPFYVVYTVVRGFVGPYFVFRMVVFYASGLASGLVPTWVWVSWAVVVFSAIGVSILWVYSRWVELIRERRTEYLDVAKTYGLHPVSLAIAFVLRHPLVASVVFGATKSWQLREVLNACKIKLTSEVIEEINKIHSRFPNPCP